MHGFSKLLAGAAVAAALAAHTAAAGPNGAGPPGFGGGAPNSSSGPVLPSPGGDVTAGPRGPSGPNRGPGGVLPPGSGGPGAGFKSPSGAAPNAGFWPPRRGLPPTPGFAGRGPGGPGGGDWRRRPRHYWLGGGPIFVPDPSGDYAYSEDDYDDGGDPTGCWIYRKAYDRAGRFLGFVHVDQCEGQ